MVMASVCAGVQCGRIGWAGSEGGLADPQVLVHVAGIEAGGVEGRERRWKRMTSDPDHTDDCVADDGRR